MSEHANAQAQRRCIDSLIIDYLIEFGKTIHCGGGCTKYFFDNAARKRVKGSTNKSLYAKIEKKLHSFLVIDECSCEVVTVGHQFKKIRK